MLRAPMLRRTLSLALLALLACDAEPAPTKPAAEETAKPDEPAKPAEPAALPAAPPAPEAKAKPAFLREPERLNRQGKPFADHERRQVDVAGLTRRGSEQAAVVIVGCVDLAGPLVRGNQKYMAELYKEFPKDVALFIRPYWKLIESFEKAVKRGDKGMIARRDLSKLLTEALVAAELQGKIWEMHDLVLAADIKELDRESLTKLAADAGLDVEKWKAALASKETEAAIDAHKKACNALGVDRNVPAYFIDGRKIGTARPEDVKYLIEVELAGGFEVLPTP